jgi:hypothetical protein
VMQILARRRDAPAGLAALKREIDRLADSA